MRKDRVISALINLGVVFCLLSCVVAGVIIINRSINSFKENLTNLISPSFTVAEKYEITDKANFIEEITSSKVLISYNDSTYKLILSDPVDFIDGQEVNITVKFTEMESGSTYSTITGIGDFKVESCTKVID